MFSTMEAATASSNFSPSFLQPCSSSFSDHDKCDSYDLAVRTLSSGCGGKRTFFPLGSQEQESCYVIYTLGCRPFSKTSVYLYSFQEESVTSCTRPLQTFFLRLHISSVKFQTFLSVPSVMHSHVSGGLNRSPVQAGGDSWLELYANFNLLSVWSVFIISGSRAACLIMSHQSGEAEDIFVTAFASTQIPQIAPAHTNKN